MVIDVGRLLYQVHWDKIATYSELAKTVLDQARALTQSWLKGILTKYCSLPWMFSVNKARKDHQHCMTKNLHKMPWETYGVYQPTAKAVNVKIKLV